MKKETIEMLGNLGAYVDEDNVITFQVGGAASALREEYGTERPATSFFTPRFLRVDNLNVATRGANNKSCQTIKEDIKSNRLLPTLIDKQVKMLYGKGIAPYVEQIVDGKLQRTWQKIDEITDWLESWETNGVATDYNTYAMEVIKRYYFFKDFFSKIRFTKGKQIGKYPVAGMELLENENCLLATTKQDVTKDKILYKDFQYVVFGDWQFGNSQYKVYPLFKMADVDKYDYAAISHHKESSVGEYYGLNETHEGVKVFLKTSNELPVYIDSFLANSLAAKIHVIIPEAWVDAKRKQIRAICEENKKRVKENKAPLKYNGVDVGTVFRESSVIQFMNIELRKLSEYLSGAKNQGKAYATYSFKTGNTEEQRWKIETIDLKYKEYITSLIDYDKRVDEVLISAVGIDSSISAVSKPGMISKSGSDAYYNFIIYLLSLTPDDIKCSEPFNIALKLNFPELYKQGVRLGFYREIPARQEDVSTNNRLNQQQA